MTLNKKIRILISIVAFLLALNLATWLTFYYKKQQAEVETGIVTDASKGAVLNGRFFRHELGFDEEQMRAYRIANKSFRAIANPLIFEIDSLKHVLFDELNSAEPDTTQTSRLALHIGAHHSQLKLATNVLYLELRKIANPEQSEALRMAFLPLFEDKANRSEEQLLFRRGHRAHGGMKGYNGRNNNQKDSIVKP